MLTEELKTLIGNVPNDQKSKFRAKMRIHQGWWRTFVLGQEQGEHPQYKNKTICNTIRNGEENNNNFLTERTVAAVRETLAEWQDRKTGIINENRLFNNLLSSQPLCFNFFGELRQNKKLALSVLQEYFPDITAVNNVYFEYGPNENETGDNSAFDVAFDICYGSKHGLFGLECKYTDDFSHRPEKSKVNYGDVGNKNYDAYLKIYNGSKDYFIAEYYEYVRNAKFNQLFRNELIRQVLLQNKKYDFVETGILCHHDDSNAISTSEEFKKRLQNNGESFHIITYKNFIETIQKRNVDWQIREWTMLLWSRYCSADKLSCIIRK